MSMKMMKDAADGNLDIVEVDDNDLHAAMAQGYKPFVRMYDTRGDEQYVTHEEIDKALKQGFSMGETKNQYKPSAGESFSQGGISGIPFGSEIVAGGRSIVNDKGFDQNLTETLEDQRVAREANPASSFAGSLVSSAPYLGIPGVNASNLGGAVATGAGIGATYGSSNMQGDVLDRTTGGIIGGITGATASTLPWAIKNAAPAYQGAKAGLAQTFETPLNPMKNVQAATGTYSEVKKAKELLDKTGGSAALFEEGPNAIKEWAAKKAATHGPNNLDQENLTQVFNLGLRKRQQARQFDPRAAAEQHLPAMEKMQKSFGDEAGKAYGSLRENVPEELGNIGFDDVSGPFSKFESERTKIDLPSRTADVAKRTQDVINEGIGLEQLGLTPGKWDEINPTEQIRRIHTARRMLDSEINWTSRESMPGANSLLKGMRSSLDDILKQSPSQVQADAMYSEFKNLQGKLFETLQMSKETNIDKYKLARTFADTDAANRFRDNVDHMSNFLNDYGHLMQPEDAAEMQQTIAALNESMGIAGNKRAIEKLRYAPGPTSPAVEAMESTMQNRGFHGDFIRSPGGSLKSADQSMENMAQKYYNKEYSELTEQERRRLSQALVRDWANKKATDSAKEKAMTKFITKGKTK